MKLLLVTATLLLSGDAFRSLSPLRLQMGKRLRRSSSSSPSMIHTQPAQELECTPPETLSPPSGGDPVCTASHKEDPTPIVTQENPVGRVLLCYTGGTLGMVKQAGSWSPQQARGGLAALIASMIEFQYAYMVVQ